MDTTTGTSWRDWLRERSELGICALLAALSVVLARLIIPMPNATTRFSIEAVPVFLAGMLFGPIPGALVGAAADAVGCLFSGYGFNPLFTVPPILYGLCGGLFRPLLARRMRVGTVALAFLPAVVLGSILYQSWSLAFVYTAHGTLRESFLYYLGTRSIQFAVTFVLDVLVVWALYKSNVFQAVHLWPPVLRRDAEGSDETQKGTQL